MNPAPRPAESHDRVRYATLIGVAAAPVPADDAPRPAAASQPSGAGPSPGTPPDSRGSASDAAPQAARAARREAGGAPTATAPRAGLGRRARRGLGALIVVFFALAALRALIGRWIAPASAPPPALAEQRERAAVAAAALLTTQPITDEPATPAPRAASVATPSTPRAAAVPDVRDAFAAAEPPLAGGAAPAPRGTLDAALASPPRPLPAAPAPPVPPSPPLAPSPRLPPWPAPAATPPLQRALDAPSARDPLRGTDGLPEPFRSIPVPAAHRAGVPAARRAAPVASPDAAPRPIPDLIEGEATPRSDADPLARVEVDASVRLVDAALAPFDLLRTRTTGLPRQALLAVRPADPARTAAWYDLGQSPAPGWSLTRIEDDVVELMTPNGNLLRLARHVDR